MYLVDSNGIVRWQNASADELTGNRVGTRVSAAIAPEFRRRAEQSMSRQMLGAEGTVEADSAALNDGRRVGVRIRRIPIKGADGVVGILGVVRQIEPVEDTPPRVQLPPRQHETLRLLACGHSTEGIAAELGVSLETARNYVRRLLRSLGVHSRIEAVAYGRRLGLV